jgi:hypothetical protein
MFKIVKQRCKGFQMSATTLSFNTVEVVCSNMGCIIDIPHLDIVLIHTFLLCRGHWVLIKYLVIHSRKKQELKGDN